MMNHIDLMGRITKDPEIRYTQQNTPVASFSVACERDTKERETDFINAVAWRQTAEFVQKYFKKGMLVGISGRLQMRSWEDKTGQKRTSAEVVCDHVYFAESKQSAAQRPVSVSAADFDDLDDDGPLPWE